MDVGVDQAEERPVLNARDDVGQDLERVSAYGASGVGDGDLDGVVKSGHRADLLGYAGGQPGSDAGIVEVERLDADADALSDPRERGGDGGGPHAAHLRLSHNFAVLAADR